MLTVGLTGGIGSGKSTVAALLSELGAVVIDADQVAREVVEPGTPTLAAIAERFGAQLIQPDGSLDRAGLAAIAFPDPAALADLNAITGPAITARVAEQRAAVDPAVISVFDMPLLVEHRLWPHEHLTLVVGAEEAVRLDRLVAQRGLSEDDARHRIAAQATDEQRRAAADVWIDNNGDCSATEEQVRRLWADRLGPFNDNLVSHTRSKRPETNAVVDPDPTWPTQAARLVARIEDALADLPSGPASVDHGAGQHAAVQPSAVRNSAVRQIAVDHIGSTSVPALIAKDVIDLQIGVPRLVDADAPEFVAALEQRGFLLVADNTQDTAHPPRDDPRDWRKRFYSSTDPGRIANVHVREIGSPGWEFALMFRDWLRANPGDTKSYAAEKRRLLAAVTSTTEYVDAKEPWFVTAYPRVVEWAGRTGWTARGSGALGDGQVHERDDE